MNKTQIEYARSRINQVAQDKIEDFRKTLPAEKSEEHTFEEKYALIASGKARLLPLKKIGKYTDLDDAYEYPAVDPKNAQFNIDRQKKIDAFAKKVYAEAGNVTDKFVFSDFTDAGPMIAEFRATKF